MIIAINGRIFPTTGLVKGPKTAEFLQRLLSHGTYVSTTGSASTMPPPASNVVKLRSVPHD